MSSALPPQPEQDKTYTATEVGMWRSNVYLVFDGADLNDDET